MPPAASPRVLVQYCYYQRDKALIWAAGVGTVGADVTRLAECGVVAYVCALLEWALRGNWHRIFSKAPAGPLAIQDFASRI